MPRHREERRSGQLSSPRDSSRIEIEYEENVSARSKKKKPRYSLFDLAFGVDIMVERARKKKAQNDKAAITKSKTDASTRMHTKTKRPTQRRHLRVEESEESGDEASGSEEIARLSEDPDESGSDTDEERHPVVCLKKLEAEAAERIRQQQKKAAKSKRDPESPSLHRSSDKKTNTKHEKNYHHNQKIADRNRKRDEREIAVRKHHEKQHAQNYKSKKNQLQPTVIPVSTASQPSYVLGHQNVPVMPIYVLSPSQALDFVKSLAPVHVEASNRVPSPVTTLISSDSQALLTARSSPTSNGSPAQHTTPEKKDLFDVEERASDRLRSSSRRHVRRASRAHSPRSRNYHHQKRVSERAAGSVSLSYYDFRRKTHLCYECGNVRSGQYHSEHTVRRGKVPPPSLCSRCREKGPFSSEHEDKDYYRRHWCYECGTLRSAAYHHDYPPGAKTPARDVCHKCEAKRVPSRDRIEVVYFDSESSDEEGEPADRVSPPQSRCPSPAPVRSRGQASGRVQSDQGISVERTERGNNHGKLTPSNAHMKYSSSSGRRKTPSPDSYSGSSATEDGQIHLGQKIGNEPSGRENSHRSVFEGGLVDTCSRSSSQARSAAIGEHRMFNPPASDPNFHHPAPRMAMHYRAPTVETLIDSTLHQARDRSMSRSPDASARSQRHTPERWESASDYSRVPALQSCLSSGRDSSSSADSRSVRFTEPAVSGQAVAPDYDRTPIQTDAQRQQNQPEELQKSGTKSFGLEYWTAQVQEPQLSSGPQNERGSVCPDRHSRDYAMGSSREGFSGSEPSSRRHSDPTLQPKGLSDLYFQSQVQRERERAHANSFSPPSTSTKSGDYSNRLHNYHDQHTIDHSYRCPEYGAESAYSRWSASSSHRRAEGEAQPPAAGEARWCDTPTPPSSAGSFHNPSYHQNDDFDHIQNSSQMPDFGTPNFSYPLSPSPQRSGSPFSAAETDSKANATSDVAEAEVWEVDSVEADEIETARNCYLVLDTTETDTNPKNAQIADTKLVGVDNVHQRSSSDGTSSDLTVVMHKQHLDFATLAKWNNVEDSASSEDALSCSSSLDPYYTASEISSLEDEPTTDTDKTVASLFAHTGHSDDGPF
ncbi:hypothetical protein QBC46DRAFT_413599 [Diplogelasinospora grovesii]|uniref:Uncharacterized protein n=1 Tax=Diplogelasinospora grovesii TaxID=303347 RepID=A0AAN6MWI9_9PEZI|nr:hypothetical protein QBC46DRAFT_413599 [Diplogelasinospora grovesii]